MADILIVDDDELLCGAIEKKITRLGHTGASVHTLRDAYEKSLGGDYDIIFLDVRMPDGNGLEILPRLKAVSSSPEIIIITGAGDPDGAELAIKSGAWCYLEKPTIIRDLILPLTRALQYRSEKSKTAAVRLKRNNLIGSSPQIVKCLDRVGKVGKNDANVLITGETGTGKEVFARTIHENSNRAKKNFVVVDCASLPEKLVETTLFGHEKGAFTDASKPNKGLIKQADGGTLFLDEIGELPFDMQKAFLRVLEEKSFRPVGSIHETSSNFRLIAATNRDLHAMEEQGSFRRDLLFRIESCTINIPPLRERLGDIRDLTDFCIKTLCERYGQARKNYSDEFVEALMNYDWPGNVRELFRVLDHVFTEAFHSPKLFALHLPERIRILHARMNVRGEASDTPQLQPCSPGAFPVWREARDSFEKKYVQDLIVHVAGNIQAASRASGLSRTRLYQLLEKHSISHSH